MAKPSKKPPALPEIEMLRIVSLQEAERLSGLSAETLRRVCRDRLIQLSPRRLGIRVGVALQLMEPAA